MSISNSCLSRWEAGFRAVVARQHGASPLVIGVIFALGGAGAIVGSLLSPFWEKHLSVGQSILLCRWSFVLLVPLYLLIPVPLLMGLAEFGVGFADTIEDVPYFSYRLSLIPEELRGRVISVCRLVPRPGPPVCSPGHRRGPTITWSGSDLADLLGRLTAARVAYHE